MATDANRETLTYTLSGTDAVSFDIEPATGQLKTKAPLNYEAKDSYRVTVTARDPGRLSDTITVTITVTDVEEAGTGDALLDEYDPNGDGTIESDRHASGSGGLLRVSRRRCRGRICGDWLASTSVGRMLPFCPVVTAGRGDNPGLP